MEDRELNALIRLLDDEDPEVSTHVWEKLTSLGATGIDRLEAAWEIQEDPIIQKKIEDLINRIHLDEITDELLAWRKGGGKDLLEGWMLVTRFHFPDLDYSAYKNEINRLVNVTWLEINNTMDAVSKLKVLNHILFQIEGFKGDRETTAAPENHFLNHVFNQKKGNPVSLALLYLIICKKLEFRVSGVILPGYFVLHFKDRNQEFYIDVYNGGAFFSKKDLTRFLKEIKVEPKPSYFKPTSNIYMILRTIQNLKESYRKEGRDEKVQDLERLLSEIEISF